MPARQPSRQTCNRLGRMTAPWFLLMLRVVRPGLGAPSSPIRNEPTTRRFTVPMEHQCLTHCPLDVVQDLLAGQINFREAGQCQTSRICRQSKGKPGCVFLVRQLLAGPLARNLEAQKQAKQGHMDEHGNHWFERRLLNQRLVCFELWIVAYGS